MNIIYYCYGSSHSSIIAAHIHLRSLPKDRIPTEQELRKLWDFDTNDKTSIGTLYFKGIDSQQRRVYTMGMGKEMDLVRETFLSMIEISGGKREDYIFNAALPHINTLTKVGGALSRRYGWVFIGRKLAIMGIQRCYPELVQFVNQCIQANRPMEN